jgi:NADPH2:quinone reductase
MRAVRVDALDGPSSAVLAEVPDLQPAQGAEGADDLVLIEVHAAGITYPDVLMSRGRYQFTPQLPYIPGSQVAGSVLSAPAGSGFGVGDRVCAFTVVGGFAERVAVGPGQVLPAPPQLSWEAAAASLTNYLTAHFALLLRGRLRAGEWVLVHGAAGGVGLAGIQVARSAGATVIAVASSEAKRQAALRSGADHVLGVEDFRAGVRDLTGGRGVDVVLDPVGGDRFTDSLRSLAQGGRLVVVGFVGGEIPTVKVNRLLLNNIEVVGAAWGEYAMTNPGYAGRQWADLLPRFAAGELVPEIAAVLPLADAARGLSMLDDRLVIGNVVLSLTAQP